MQINSDYLEEFAVAEPGEPNEIPLHGWEMDGNGGITLDDTDGHSISFLHWDDWPSDKPWKIKKGTDKRWTFVLLRDQDSNIVGDHGWEFEGLVGLDTLRDWFRAHLGFDK